MEDQLISIEEIIKILKKRRKIIVIITLLSTLASVVLSFFVIEPKYEASTKLFIGKETTEANQSYSQSDVIMYQTLMKTYCEVIKTNDLILKAAKEANIDLNAEEVLENLSVITIADTQILEVSFKSENAKEARDLIEEITKEFIKISKELFPNGNVKVLQQVSLPEKPVSPNKIINISIAFLLGLIVSVALSFLLEFFHKTRV
ncbi:MULTISPECIES: YveK family protein [Clostridium]|uniref:YveK family protein n=1 Tax=Clostridium TaxID=1485 RepID=UPI00115B2E02|nr:MULTISPECIES: Wzz/FepE/Etk N-terminal domain-containing protein [Clostridium]MBS5306106.1 capsular biosynthesis protein [Clostridium sp.]MBS6503450.1 capsular biosynthesis protein [Clostridium sp.]MDB1934386.1 Wzz/FepE/Etk N-terminal domain-containing protein [Clostridium tertium]MDB1935887.1 Wzz/FepE/Etk N-terminal domain-containing protein [Clostridium tertium]MDB1944533.1 Wzz/FepE/Etk N-terminal domain-containing protein [Clostridium tertium]